MSKLKCRHCYQLIDFRAKKCNHCGGWEPITDNRGNFFPSLDRNGKEIIRYVVRVGRNPKINRHFDDVVRASAEKLGKNPGSWPHRLTDSSGIWKPWNGDIKFELKEAFAYVCSVLHHGGDGYIHGSFTPTMPPSCWGEKARITVPVPAPARRAKPAAAKPAAAKPKKARPQVPDDQMAPGDTITDAVAKRYIKALKINKDKGMSPQQNATWCQANKLPITAPQIARVLANPTGNTRSITEDEVAPGDKLSDAFAKRYMVSIQGGVKKGWSTQQNAAWHQENKVPITASQMARILG